MHILRRGNFFKESYELIKEGNYIEVTLNELENHPDGDIGLRRVRGKVRQLGDEEYGQNERGEFFNGAIQTFVLELNPATHLSIHLKDVIGVKKWSQA